MILILYLLLSVVLCDVIYLDSLGQDSVGCGDIVQPCRSLGYVAAFVGNKTNLAVVFSTGEFGGNLECNYVVNNNLNAVFGLQNQKWNFTGVPGQTSISGGGVCSFLFVQNAVVSMFGINFNNWSNVIYGINSTLNVSSSVFSGTVSAFGLMHLHSSVSVFLNSVFKNVSLISENGIGGALMQVHSGGIYLNSCEFLNSFVSSSITIVPVVGGHLNFVKVIGVVSNCIFSNSSSDYGGVLGVSDSILIIDSSIFSYSTSLRGSGAHIYAMDSVLSLTNSSFVEALAFSPKNIRIVGLGGSSYYLKCVVTFNNSFFGALTLVHFNGGHIYSESSMIKIYSSIFRNATISGYGGSIYTFNSEMWISHSIFSFNRNYYSGGTIASLFSKLVVSNSEFSNSFSNWGSIMYTINTYADISHTTFRDSQSSNFGGLTFEVDGDFHFSGPVPTVNITSCYFYNLNGFIGSGLVFQNSGIFDAINFVANIDNCTFFKNTASNSASVIYSSGWAILVLRTELSYNTASFGSLVFADIFVYFRECRFTFNNAITILNYHESILFLGTAFVLDAIYHVSNSVFDSNRGYCVSFEPFIETPNPKAGTTHVDTPYSDWTNGESRIKCFHIYNSTFLNNMGIFSISNTNMPVVIDSILVKAGFSNGNSLIVIHSQARVIISYSLFQNCTSNDSIVYLKDSSILFLLHSSFLSNNGTSIHLFDSSKLIARFCYFFQNFGEFGGAVQLSKYLSSASFQNCDFINNFAYNGGAIYSLSSRLVFKNCSFVSNSAIFVDIKCETSQLVGYGGAIYFSSESLNELFCSNGIFTEFVTFSGNRAAIAGGSVYFEYIVCQNASDIVNWLPFSNSIFLSSSASFGDYYASTPVASIVSDSSYIVIPQSPFSVNALSSQMKANSIAQNSQVQTLIVKPGQYFSVNAVIVDAFGQIITSEASHVKPYIKVYGPVQNLIKISWNYDNIIFDKFGKVSLSELKVFIARSLVSKGDRSPKTSYANVQKFNDTSSSNPQLLLQALSISQFVFEVVTDPQARFRNYSAIYFAIKFQSCDFGSSFVSIDSSYQWFECASVGVFSKEETTSLLVLAVFSVSFSLFLFVFVFRYRNRTAIVVASGNFLFLFLVSSIIESLGSLLFAVPQTTLVCRFKYYVLLFGMGVSLLVIIAKLYRLYRVILNPKFDIVRIKLKDMFFSVAIGACLLIIFFVIWHFVYPPVNLDEYSGDCYGNDYFLWVLVIFLILVDICGLIMSFSVPSMSKYDNIVPIRLVLSLRPTLSLLRLLPTYTSIGSFLIPLLMLITGIANQGILIGFPLFQIYKGNSKTKINRSGSISGEPLKLFSLFNLGRQAAAELDLKCKFLEEKQALLKSVTAAFVAKQLEEEIENKRKCSIASVESTPSTASCNSSDVSDLDIIKDSNRKSSVASVSSSMPIKLQEIELANKSV